MRRIGSTSLTGRAHRAPLVGLGALALGAALAVAVSSGPAAAESAAAAADVTVSTSASTADVLPGEAFSITATVLAASGQPVEGVTLAVALPAGLTRTGPDSGPVVVHIEPGVPAIVSFDVEADAALDSEVTALTIVVSTSTGAHSSVVVAVLRQDAISVADLGPAVAAG